MDRLSFLKSNFNGTLTNYNLIKLSHKTPIVLKPIIEYSNYFVFTPIRMDATLRELTGLIKEVNIESRVRGTTFDFVLVTPEYNSPRFNGFEIGTTIAGNRSTDDSKTLGNTR